MKRLATVVKKHARDSGRESVAIDKTGEVLLLTYTRHYGSNLVYQDGQDFDMDSYVSIWAWIKEQQRKQCFPANEVIVTDPELANSVLEAAGEGDEAGDE